MFRRLVLDAVNRAQFAWPARGREPDDVARAARDGQAARG